ncbi:MAG: efflux RND transporter periplasmic adaptor subunit [Burkholderiales bacterium]|nr:efflux RND transporter periplasmic adaptor subunit [Burkholderiales bacterium]
MLTLLAGAALFGLGAAGGVWWAQRAPATAATHAAKPTAAAEKKVLYWYDPMMPNQKFDQPGKSPFMDMQLVPKYAADAGDGNLLKIDARQAQNLGMRLATVTRIAGGRQLDLSGVVGFDEHEVSVIQTRSAGFVEKVAPLAVGDVVAPGAVLAELLVPEWTAAQQEFLVLKKHGEAELLAAARDRLRLLGMPDRLIREVEGSGKVSARIRITADRGGMLQELGVRAGMSLAAGQTVARINGLSSVWLEAALPEAQAADIKVGQAATIRLASQPGGTLPGKVTALLPALNEASRSLRVRIALPNPGGALRPGLTAQVSLQGGAQSSGQDSALAVPTEALLRTGQRTLVMLAQEQGLYQPLEVQAGREVGANTVILQGLQEGQKVVASGQFLLDSEASLKGVAARALASAPAPAPAVALHQADATIVAIYPDEVTLRHGPFKSLQMEGMTMPFALARPELAKGWKVGDKVRVSVRETEDGLVVEKLEKLPGGQP